MDDRIRDLSIEANFDKPRVARQIDSVDCNQALQDLIDVENDVRDLFGKPKNLQNQSQHINEDIENPSNDLSALKDEILNGNERALKSMVLNPLANNASTGMNEVPIFKLSKSVGPGDRSKRRRGKRHVSLEPVPEDTHETANEIYRMFG